MPLDPAYPTERLRFMLEDCGPVVLLTQSHLRELFTELDDALLVVDLAETAIWQDLPDTKLDPDSIGLGPNHLAYVIYTSGSTGTPKGVMIGHGSVVNQVGGLKRRDILNASDRMLQFASVTFDVSVEEIFGVLLSGATLVLRSDAWLTGAREFWGLCSRHQLSVVNLPTLFWQQLVQEGEVAIPEHLRLLIIGGDAVSSKAMAVW